MGIRLRAAERRAQLLGVARRLFARDGYRGASMESIAEAAGVTKPVLYQHFSSKRALYEALLASELGRLTEELETAFSQAGGNEERLRRGFGAYLDFVDRHEDAFRLLFTEALGLDADFREQVAAFRHWVAGRVATIIAAEAGLAVPRARALAAAIVGMAEGAAGWWLDERRPLEAGELADELTGLAWKGFARFPGGTREADVPVDLP
ncbi:MAG TPA: TetR/AcrR family transcriptional regulator [Actinomycetes bacterium]|nr:TetR/AcrR family transcriptional regulator [Actinomycetes bacterium]